MLVHLYLMQARAFGSTQVLQMGVRRTDQVTRKLGYKKEIYSGRDKTIMCTALRCANKWAADASVKLGAKASGNQVEALIRDWFGDEDTTDEQVKAAI